MELTFQEFILQISQNPLLLIITILIVGVVFVNGWIDAPNAIATCISTRSISAKKALIMFSIFCFLGVLVMTLLGSTVAQTIYNIVDFGDNSKNALIAMNAALVAIILWSIMAWLFGIPTSQSHALIAGISGAAIAIQSRNRRNKYRAVAKSNLWLIYLYNISIYTGILNNKNYRKVLQKY